MNILGSDAMQNEMLMKDLRKIAWTEVAKYPAIDYGFIVDPVVNAVYEIGVHNKLISKKFKRQERDEDTLSDGTFTFPIKFNNATISPVSEVILDEMLTHMIDLLGEKYKCNWEYTYYDVSQDCTTFLVTITLDAL